MKTLYVFRPLFNAAEFMDWAFNEGFTNTLPINDVHTTIAYSKQPVDWDSFTPQTSGIKVSYGTRQVLPLGNQGAVVLKYRCPFLEQRWKEICDGGCSWDFPTFKPHVTITYSGSPLDLSKVKPYTGNLIFGPEEFQELDPEWRP
jgi:hypothetical protein